MLIYSSYYFQDRLIANEFIQCRKVCEHVIDKILGAEITPGAGNSNSSQNNSQSDANSEGSQVLAEDKIELLCNEVVSSFFLYFKCNILILSLFNPKRFVIQIWI